MKTVIIAIIFSVAIIGLASYAAKGPSTSTTKKQEAPAVQNVSVVDGKQIIEIEADGGYTPRVSAAQANLPTVIRFKTNGNFDCSSSVRIPSLNINKYLPNTGTTDIDIGTPVAGLFKGSCGMGMYRFEINFK